MKIHLNSPPAAWRRFTLVALALICMSSAARSQNRETQAMNAFGTAVRDAEGRPLNNTQEELLTMEILAGTTNTSVSGAEKLEPSGFVPPSGAARPFWQYAIFGSGIGASNIIIGPAPAGGGAREIIVGGNSTNNFGGDDFWQVLRRNPATGNYDQLFVSPDLFRDHQADCRGQCHWRFPTGDCGHARRMCAARVTPWAPAWWTLMT